MRSRPPLLLDPGEFLRQRGGLLVARLPRELRHRGVEVSRELIRRGRMLKREIDQLIEDVIPSPCARVPEGRTPGHHLVGDPAEAAGDPDTDVASVLPPEPPARGQHAEVLITFDEVI